MGFGAFPKFVLLFIGLGFFRYDAIHALLSGRFRYCCLAFSVSLRGFCLSRFHRCNTTTSTLLSIAANNKRCFTSDVKLTWKRLRAFGSVEESVLVIVDVTATSD